MYYLYIPRCSVYGNTWQNFQPAESALLINIFSECLPYGTAGLHMHAHTKM